MHPLLKCCGYYCACLAFFSLPFYIILIGLVDSENAYLVGGEGDDAVDDKIDALVIALIVNGVCFVLCTLCVIFGRIQEANEEKKKLAIEENGVNLPSIKRNL
jgi:hypothetical protein